MKRSLMPNHHEFWDKRRLIESGVSRTFKRRPERQGLIVGHPLTRHPKSARASTCMLVRSQHTLAFFLIIFNKFNM